MTLPCVSHSTCSSRLVRLCSFYGDGSSTRGKPCLYHMSNIHKSYSQAQKSRVEEGIHSTFLVAETAVTW